MTDRPKRHQSADDRDLAGLQARREREARARDQIDELAEAVAEAAPEATEEDDVDTMPVAILSAGEREVWDRLSRMKKLVKRKAKDTGDQILEAMGQRPPAERLAHLETRVKLLYTILAAIATFALGSIITTAKLLYDRGVDAGEHEQRLKTVEQRLDRYEFGSRRGFRDADPPAFFQPRTQP